MLKFKLTSKGVEENLNELILAKKLTHDEILTAVTYFYSLCRWWKHKRNQDKPTEVVRVVWRYGILNTGFCYDT